MSDFTRTILVFAAIVLIISGTIFGIWWTDIRHRTPYMEYPKQEPEIVTVEGQRFIKSFWGTYTPLEKE